MALVEADREVPKGLVAAEAAAAVATLADKEEVVGLEEMLVLEVEA